MTKKRERESCEGESGEKDRIEFSAQMLHLDTLFTAPVSSKFGTTENAWPLMNN